jgi:hypothetical protein
MKNKELLDIYSSYLISALGQTTGTGLAELMGGRVNHDQIQRLLSKERFGSAELWQIVKPYTDENDIICWHYDHSQDRSVKGINFVTSLYHAGGYSLPVGFSSVAKTEYYLDKKDGKQKRRWPVTKNQYDRALLTAAQRTQIPFRYVLNDVWYSAAENMMVIKHDLDKDFIMPFKANRKVTLRAQARRDGQWRRLDQLTFEANSPVELDLEGVDFPLLRVKQVFANEEDRTGIQ